MTPPKSSPVRLRRGVGACASVSCMPTITTFDARVAARTRAAAEILKNKDLLAVYERFGGLKDDLDQIQKHGALAEKLSMARSGKRASGEGATLDVAAAFVDVQADYVAVMAVVQAVRYDLAAAAADAQVLSALDRILVNEAATVYREVKDGDKAKRRAQKDRGQEAIRAEIHKDAVALLALTAAAAALKKRGVTAARLEALRDAAQALSSKLSDRAQKKGASQQATAGIHEAVSAQKAIWASCSRILTAAAEEDSRIRQLLKETRRRRSAQ